MNTAMTTGGSRSGDRTSWTKKASTAPKNWVLKKTNAEGVQPSDGEESWHAFGDMAPGFNMLDPIKATIITPGLNMDGRFDEAGIPASIVTKYLAEHGVVVEKTGLYSFFIMFTIGITKGRWNSLLTELQQFKDDYDKNQPMWRCMPEFCAKHPHYEHMGLRDLCQHVHSLYAKYDVAILSTEMYLSDLTPAMKPTRCVFAYRPRDPPIVVEGRHRAPFTTGA